MSIRIWRNHHAQIFTNFQTKSFRTFIGTRLNEHGSNYELSERHSAVAKAKVVASGNSLYPRIQTQLDEKVSGRLPKSISCKDVLQRWHEWAELGSPKTTDLWVTRGRVMSMRNLGKNLWFIDIVADGAKVQGFCNLGLYEDDLQTQTRYRQSFHSLQRGDIVEIVGELYLTRSKEASISLLKPPKLLSPCLHPLPRKIQDQETIIGKRHVGFLTDPGTSNLIKAKSNLIQSIRQFLLNDNHIEVQTPILAANTGGAIARPFRTKTTEFTGRELALRIAPELWLKRMVVGGFDRVFEIGPSFRNEGIDLTHNPEFTTCEFYRAYTDLQGLMGMTEQMFSAAHKSMLDLDLPELLPLSRDFFTPPYESIDFISGIEHAIGAKLPDLSSSNAFEDLKQLVTNLSLPIDTATVSSLPQLLDKLSSKYLEPQCVKPTFIVNHPACMSPLSKSHEHPFILNQEVAARAELFVKEQEIANMYEEENSPAEQRQKFLQQLQFKDDGTEEIDESYLEALEWGMPPVGGWGCGIERLTMTMTGTENIRDVLSFGNLRNVISKHQRGSPPSRVLRKVV